MKLSRARSRLVPRKRRPPAVPFRLPPSSVRLRDATSIVVDSLRSLGWADADIRSSVLGALVEATKGIGRATYARRSGCALTDVPGLFILALDDDPSPWEAERAAAIVSAELDALLGPGPTAPTQDA